MGVSFLNYDAKKEWTKEFLSSEMAWPSEYVIRMFKGKYPKLNLRQEPFKGKRICDIGCGDGRNLVLLKQCEFEIYGVEITQEIVDRVKSNLQKAGITNASIQVGTNDNIPFENEYFDYLLSWNACYYMGQKEDFNEYVKEFARVLKKDGYLILSIPKKTCFIYHGSEELRKGYRLIKSDPFNVRNGEVLRVFENEEEIQETFSSYFSNFTFGSIHDDCFGYDYHWHLVVCKRK